MKIKHILGVAAAMALLGVGCSDEEVAGKGDLSLTIELSSAVKTITTVHVMGAKGSAKAEALAHIAVEDSLLLTEVLSDLPAGTYSLTIDGYVGDATAPLATTSAEVTIKADAVATLALVLGDLPELSATITASNTAPKTDEVVTFSAAVSGDGAETATLIWSDSCDGDFLTQGDASVTWSSKVVDDCVITVVASTPATSATATLALGVTTPKGTLTRVVGSGDCTVPTQDSGDVWDPRGKKLTGDETATNFPMTKLMGIDTDSAGNLVFTERNAGRIWRYNPSSKALTRIAGPIDPYNDSGSYTGDAGPATQATFNYPFGIDVDGATGDIYVSDAWQQRAYRIYADAMTVYSVAGNGQCWSQPTNGVLARGNCLGYYPSGIAVAPDSSFFIALSQWQDYLVKVDGTTKIMTRHINNNSQYSTFDLAIYGDYVYATNREEHSVFKIPMAGGPITDVAGAYYDGAGIAGFSGDGSYAYGAKLFDPRGIYIDQANGDIYISDSGNFRIRKITQSGMISTVLQTHGAAQDLVMDAARNIYYTDRDSCSVIKAQGPY